MDLSKKEIQKLFREWIGAWNEHDLDMVMTLMHDDVVFENWTCAKVRGKEGLRKAWTSWFSFHGNFRFIEEDLFFDEENQKLLFGWRLEWPSFEEEYKGKHEIRRGVDVIHFYNGKIIRKYSYSKTTLQIDGRRISLRSK